MRRLFCIVALLCGSSSQTTYAQDARPDRFAAFRENSLAYINSMKLLEASMRANYEQLKTWSGRYDLEEYSAITRIQLITKDKRLYGLEGDLALDRKVTVQFAIDLPKNLLFTTYDLPESVLVTNRSTKEKTNGLVIPRSSRHVLTKEQWLRTDLSWNAPASELVGTNVGMRSTAEDALQFSAYSFLVDPRSFYESSTGLSFIGGLRTCIDYANKGNDLPLVITTDTSEGNAKWRLTQEYRLGDDRMEPPTVVEKVFDSTDGITPLSMTCKNPEGLITDQREWTFRKVKGISIPERYTLRKYKQDKLILKRAFRLVECQVNEPLADSIFSWENLGLAEGYRVVDKIQGTTLQYQNGNLVPVVDQR